MAQRKFSLRNETSPDRKTQNQIDQAMIDGGHVIDEVHAVLTTDRERAMIEARRICRQKRKWPRCVSIKLEKLIDKRNSRKLYEKIRRLTEWFKAKADSCRTHKGDQTIDAHSILILWIHQSMTMEQILQYPTIEKFE